MWRRSKGRRIGTVVLGLTFHAVREHIDADGGEEWDADFGCPYQVHIQAGQVSREFGFELVWVELVADEARSVCAEVCSPDT